MEVSAHNETFTLPEAPGDRSQLERLWELLDAMQEAAGRHAATLGVGVRDLHAKGLTWVLARMHVEIANIPAAGETVRIATWPAGRHRLFAVREFKLSDAAGGEILRATSAWALMNMETRRPSRLDPHLPVFTHHPERMVADDFAPLPPVERPGIPTRFSATAADIDINDHVNNTVYLDWALRAVPAGVRGKKPLSLEVAFLGEARLGDEVLSFSKSADLEGATAGTVGTIETTVRQSLRDASGGRELTRLRWRF